MHFTSPRHQQTTKPTLLHDNSCFSSRLIFTNLAETVVVVILIAAMQLIHWPNWISFRIDGIDFWVGLTGTVNLRREGSSKDSFEGEGS